MTDVRQLNAQEVVFSLDFVIKLVKAVHKANPAYSVEQIAAAVELTFAEKLGKMEKRLQNIEKVRAQYQALKSAEPVVEGVLDTLVKAQAFELQPINPELLKPATSKKAASAKPAKANGAAIEQTSLAV